MSNELKIGDYVVDITKKRKMKILVTSQNISILDKDPNIMIKIPIFDISEREYSLLKRVTGRAWNKHTQDTYFFNSITIIEDSEDYPLALYLQKRKLLKYNGPTSKTSKRYKNIPQDVNCHTFYFGSGTFGYMAVAAYELTNLRK